MQYVTFQDGPQPRLGILRGESVVPLQFSGDMLALMRSGAAAVEQDRAIPLSSVQLLAPLANPGKIVAVGLNYMDHCREQNVAPPEKPLVFAKFPSAIVGPGAAISWDPALATQVDFEVELGVVIGKLARNVAPEEALAHVFGYTVLNDISARDLQFSDGQWVRGKSLDGFCPLGPAIVSADEVPDPQALALRCLVNGVALQDSSTAEMIFGVAALISYLSHSFTLYPGDLIATGTPYGVGAFRQPPIFLQDGDTLVSEIGGLGRLENSIVLHQ